jgi:hypothetical protein
MERTRITITIDPFILDAVDALISYGSASNRSQAIEQLVRRGVALDQLGHLCIILDSDAPVSPTNLATIQSIAREYPIKTLSVIFPGEAGNQVSSIRTALATLVPLSHSRDLSGSFGSANALRMLYDQLSSHILVLDLHKSLPSNLPQTMVLQHLTSTMLATRSVTADPAQLDTFITTALTLLDKDALLQTPAGYADLNTTLFPILQERSRVSVYAL